MSDGREEAIQLAGALQIKVDDIFAENAELRAENDSLRVAFDAVSSENMALRNTLEQRTRQRDSAMRTADLLDDKMRKIQATANEAMRAIHPSQHDKLPPVDTAANLSFLKRPQHVSGRDQ